jgi:hypothetical protein
LPLAAFPRIANADEWDRTAGLSPLQDRNSSSLGWPYVTVGAPRRAVRLGSAAWSRRESCVPPAEPRVGPDRENHVPRIVLVYVRY